MHNVSSGMSGRMRAASAAVRAGGLCARGRAQPFDRSWRPSASQVQRFCRSFVLGGEGVEWGQRHDVCRFHDQVVIDRDQRVGLQLGDGEVLRFPHGVPSVLERDPPCGPARYPITEHPNPHLGDPFVLHQRLAFGQLIAAHSTEKQIQRLGTNAVGSDELMSIIERHLGGNDMDESVCINDISSHDAHPRQEVGQPGQTVVRSKIIDTTGVPRRDRTISSLACLGASALRVRVSTEPIADRRGEGFRRCQKGEMSLTSQRRTRGR
jgi:hypothetical protein